MKIVESLEESELLIVSASEKIQNATKEQASRFLGMLLGTLDASLLEKLLSGKGVYAGDRVILSGEGKTIVGQNFNATSSFD